LVEEFRSLYLDSVDYANLYEQHGHDIKKWIAYSGNDWGSIIGYFEGTIEDVATLLSWSQDFWVEPNFPYLHPKYGRIELSDIEFQQVDKVTVNIAKSIALKKEELQKQIADLQLQLAALGG
jgi:hypothetical protein